MTDSPRRDQAHGFEVDEGEVVDALQAVHALHRGAYSTP